MKILRVLVVGMALGFGALGCGIFSEATTNPTPTRIVLVAPTAALLPTALPTNAPPTRAPVAPTDPNAQIVTVRESELNQQLNQNLQDAQVSNVMLDFHPGNTASISATLKLNSLTLRPTAGIKFGVANNRITIEVTQVSVGGLGVPRSMVEPQVAELKNMAEHELNSQLADLAATTGLKLQAITTTENEMTLYYAP